MNNGKNFFLRTLWTTLFVGIVLLALGSQGLGASLNYELDSLTRPVTWYLPASSINYNVRNRTAEDINYIVIHTVQGSLSSALRTFSSDDLEHPRSAHYTIGIDGAVVKSVNPEDIAWHAGTSLPGSGGEHESHIVNGNSIGIEHAGYVSDPNFPSTSQYISSAALVRLLCEKYDIPLDRNHIVGHEEIKSTKGDPGSNWDWDYYMHLVKYGTVDDFFGVEAPGGKASYAGRRSLLAALCLIGAGILALVVSFE